MDFRVQDHVDELRSAEVFGSAGAVEVIQTHVSVVALCGAFAFKFKKAVRLPFLDFSTQQRREQACLDELRLNRRLCPAVYLDVVPLRRTRDGLRAGNAPPAGGEVVDAGVRMMRLPADAMLDVMLLRNAVTPAAMAELADTLAAFHARQRLEVDAAVRAAGAPDRLIGFLLANFEETAASCGEVFDPRLHAAVARRISAVVPTLRARLEQRAARGAVVEGHGDFHARNVCMTDPPAIYDCLEFNAELRCGDVAGEVAFMAMDLRYRGHRELAEVFVDAYQNRSGDPDLRSVLPELIRYRAMVRAKVDGLGARDAAIAADQRLRLRAGARRHLRLCAFSLAEDDGLRALASCGLPASGKSHVLEECARETGWPLLSTDRIRKELCGVAPTERLEAGAYTPAMSKRVYAELLERARATAGTVLLDGNFGRLELRDQVRAVLGRSVRFAAFAIDPAIAHQRLRARSAAGSSISDADIEVFEKLRASFESPQGETDAFTLDGGAEREVSLDRIALELIAPRG